jgi:hypothetical protein
MLYPIALSICRLPLPEAISYAALYVKRVFRRPRFYGPASVTLDAVGHQDKNARQDGDYQAIAKRSHCFIP